MTQSHHTQGCPLLGASRSFSQLFRGPPLLLVSFFHFLVAVAHGPMESKWSTAARLRASYVQRRGVACAPSATCASSCCQKFKLNRTRRPTIKARCDKSAAAELDENIGMNELLAHDPQSRPADAVRSQHLLVDSWALGSQPTDQRANFPNRTSGEGTCRGARKRRHHHHPACSTSSSRSSSKWRYKSAEHPSQPS